MIQKPDTQISDSSETWTNFNPVFEWSKYSNGLKTEPICPVINKNIKFLNGGFKTLQIVPVFLPPFENWTILQLHMFQPFKT